MPVLWLLFEEVTKNLLEEKVQAVYTDNLILISETVTIYAKPDIQGDAAQLTVTNM